MHPLTLWGLRSWALLVMLGVALCWALLLVRCRRRGYPTARVFLWVLLALPVGALGGSALAFATSRVVGGGGELSAGMTVIGSTAACLGFSALFIRLGIGERPARLLDAVAFTYGLAIAFGRLGCLMNGCCFGVPAPERTPRWLTIAVGDYAPDTVAAAHYHAVSPETRLLNFPLLLAAEALLLALLAELLYRRRERLRLADGVVVCAVLASDGIARFALEATRAERPIAEGSALNPWQVLLLALATIAGLELWRRQRRRARA